MQRPLLKLIADLLLLSCGLLVFATGLVLLLEFHVGHGTLQNEALGLTRLTWINLHRLPAFGVLVGIGMHMALHWRPIVARVRHVLRRKRGGDARIEILLYVTFLVTIVTSFVPFLLIPGSPPLLGPIRLGAIAQARHHWIDLHFLAGVPALVLAVHHVGHRWRIMMHLVRSLMSRWLQLA